MKEFKAELESRILRKIRELKRIGTVSMSVDNLKQVVQPPSHTLAGAPQGGNLQWQYATMFRAVCASNASIQLFILTK